MQLINDLKPMRLYSVKRKLYIPFDPSDKKKGATIKLMARDIMTSIKMTQMPYIYNPKLFRSYYITRNVMAYIDSKGIADHDLEDKDEEIINEAIIHAKKDKRVVVIDTNGTTADYKKLADTFNSKQSGEIRKWFKRLGHEDMPFQVTVYGFNDIQDLRRATSGQAIMKYAEIVMNSFCTPHEIFVVNESAFWKIKGEEKDYDMYLKNELITWVCMTCSNKCSRRVANYIGSGMSGQAKAIIEDEWKTQDTPSDDLTFAMATVALYKDKGDKGLARLVRTGDPSILAQYNAKEFKRFASIIAGRGFSAVDDHIYKKYMESVYNESYNEEDDTLNEIIEFNKYCNKTFQYGLARNGIVPKSKTVNTSLDDYGNYYRFASPEQFVKQNGGVCWDFVAYETQWFKDNYPEIEVKTWFICHDDNKDSPTHTFLLFKLNGEWYWFESSWESYQGVWKGNSEKDVVSAVAIYSSEFQGEGYSDYKKIPLYARSYNALDKRFYGADTEKCMSLYCTNSTNINSSLAVKKFTPNANAKVEKCGKTKMNENSLNELSSPNNIDTIIFDIGSVLMENDSYNQGMKVFNSKWKKQGMKKDMFELMGQTHYELVHKNPEYENMNYLEYFKCYKEALPYECKPYAEEFLSVICDSGVVFQYTKPMLKKLKSKGYKLYYLSNAARFVHEYRSNSRYNLYDFLDYFDGGILSYDVGLMKPDPRIYELLVDKYEINKDRSIFFDDKQKNVDASIRCGIDAMVFNKSTVTYINSFPNLNALNETWLINKPDFVINLDKWAPGTPLWITGTSGDGKSTLSAKMAKENNALVISGDIVLARLSKDKESWERKLNTASKDSIFYGGNVANKLAIEFVEEHPDWPYGMKKGKVWGDVSSYMKVFFDWIYEKATTDARIANKKIIVDSCDICVATDPNFMKDQPLIIIGGSRFRAYVRRVKRNMDENDDGLLHSIFKYIAQYNSSNRPLDDHKDKFRKDMEDLVESTVIVESALNETCKDVASAREFVRKVGELAKEYDANYFIVTDGASGIHNNGNDAVKHAREQHKKWELSHGEDPDEDWSSMNESGDKSTVDKNYKKKDKYNLSDYDMTVEDNSSDNIRSEYITWKDGNKKVCQVYADIDKASDGNIWFGSLEVSKPYRGHGLSEQILDYVISKYHVTALTVYKDNEVAIRLYKKKGFKIVKNPSQVPDEYYTMIRGNSINESGKDNGKIYYALTEDEAKKKTLYYKATEYDGKRLKGVNTSLSGLKKFIIDNDLVDTCPYYTIIDRNQFEVDDSVYYDDDEYDMIAVKTPFTININNVHELNIDNLHEIGTRAEILFSTNPFENKMLLYHGSNQKLNSIKPDSFNAGTRISRPRNSSFWTPSYSDARKFAILRKIESFGYENVYFSFGDDRTVDMSIMYLKPSEYNDIINKLKNSKIYIYEKTIPKKYLGIGHSNYYEEYTVDVTVTPDKIIEESYDQFKNVISFQKLHTDNDEEIREWMNKRNSIINKRKSTNIGRNLFGYSFASIVDIKRQYKKDLKTIKL